VKRRLIQGLWGGLAIAAAVLVGRGLGRLDGTAQRERVVQAALAEIPAPNPDKYWRDVLGPNYSGPFPPYWCGAFALWALHMAELGLKLRWIVGFGFLSNLRILPARESPKPGDIAYFKKLQHHAIVERVEGQMLHLINGNAAGGSISRSVVNRSEATAVYSIDSLLS
jgi:hypothetical protein